MQNSRLVAERTSGTSEAGGLPALAPVSVALCTHNGAAYLEQQLQSILSQTHPVSEVVVSDDASDDETLSIAERVLAASDIDYRIFTRDEPLGVSRNFAFALGEARSDLIATSDQDDSWHPKKVARLVALLEGDPDALLAHSDAQLVDEDGEPLPGTLFEALEITPTEWHDYASGRQLEALTARNFVTGATMLLRASLVFRAGTAPEPWIHDEWLAVTAAIADGLRVSREALVDYRQHGANEIGQRKPSLRYKLEQATKAGGADQERRYRRALELYRRLGELGATEAQRGHLRRKVAHERNRVLLPASRVQRLPSILKWTLRGRYGTYSRGGYDIARDLFQSLDDRD